MTKSSVVEVQENSDGELFIELNDDILDAAGLQVGDAIDWIDNGDGSYTLQKKATEWVLVETVSIFRQRYMVQVPIGKSDWALDTVVCENAKEFSQEHLDETIVSHRVVSREEALNLCDRDNAYVSGWDEGKKIDTFFTTLEDIEKMETLDKND